MHLGKMNVEVSYILKEGPNDVKLETSNYEKDIGVYIDNKLKFNVQAELVANKANKTLE